MSVPVRVRLSAPVFALTYAIHCNNIKLIQDLISLDVDVNAVDLAKKTPLEQAVKLGHEHAVQELLKSKNIQINSEYQQGFTPLRTAIATAYYQDNPLFLRIAQILLDAGADYTIKDSAGKTPLDLQGAKDPMFDKYRKKGDVTALSFEKLIAH